MRRQSAINTFDDKLCISVISVDVCACDALITASIVDLGVTQPQCSNNVVDTQSWVAVTTEGQSVLEPANGQ